MSVYQPRQYMFDGNSILLNKYEDVEKEKYDQHFEDVVEDEDTSYVKIPTSEVPTPQQTKKKSAVVPVIAGLGAAAAAGVGAKMYLDHKNNSENGEEEYDEDWSENDTIEIQDDSETETHSDQEQYLDEDEYGFQDLETEKYEARNLDEIEDLQ